MCSMTDGTTTSHDCDVNDSNDDDSKDWGNDDYEEGIDSSNGESGEVISDFGVAGVTGGMGTCGGADDSCSKACTISPDPNVV